MTLLIGIVAHTSRVDRARALSDRVGANTMSLDSGIAGSGANHLSVLTGLMSMSHHYPNSTWAIVLEDDAMPVYDFRMEAQAALDHAPTSLVSFYLGTGYPAQRQRQIGALVHTDACWITSLHLRHAVAYAVNIGILPALLHGVREPLLGTRWAADDAISRWAVGTGVKTSYTNPSLVDHDDELPSTITTRMHLGQPLPGADRRRPRKAHRFGTPLVWNDSQTSL